MPDFQNPQQQDPGSQQRLLIAFVLTFVVIMLMQPLIKKYGPQPPAKPAEKQQPAEQAPQPSATPQPAAAPQRSVVPPPPAEAKKSATETETVIENDLYRIAFTNRGAQVKSWVLKRYKDTPGGKPLDLVNSAAAAKFGLPLSLWTYNPDLRQKLDSALYVASIVGARNAPATVVFEYSDGDLTVRKSFSFDHSYVVKFECAVTQGGKPVQAYPSWPAGFGDALNLPGYAAQKIEYQSGSKVERIEPKKVSGGGTLPGPFHWAGVSDQYFAAIFLPDEPENSALVTLHETLKIPKNPEKPDPNQLVDAPVLGAAVGNKNGETRQRIFVGPKALDVLDAVHASLTKEERGAVRPGASGEGEYHGPDLTGLVDFGRFFGFIAKPLFLWLKWTHDHWVANWGWCILILTVFITLALLPLRISSMKSMMKMAKVQPQLKAVQDKYKKYKFNDPRKADMNKEINEIYKREGVNPIGGCVPTLLQFPFLVAFYSMLGVALELRHANWLWVKDLSSPDPTYILPILVVVSMLVLQKMTPQGGMDPAQAKMMTLMMPVMFGFFAVSFAAGLSVYFVASNILGILQQVVLNQTQFGREMREAQMKRARKG